MVDADDLPLKRPECLSRLAPGRGYLLYDELVAGQDTDQIGSLVEGDQSRLVDNRQCAAFDQA
jgi:hypothetical protein